MVTGWISFFIDRFLAGPTLFIFFRFSGRLHQRDRWDVLRTTCLVVLHGDVRCKREPTTLILPGLQLLLKAFMSETSCLSLICLIVSMIASAVVAAILSSLRHLSLCGLLSLGRVWRGPLAPVGMLRFLMGGLLRNTFGLLIGRKAPIALLTIFLTGVVPSLVADLSPTLRALQRLLLFLDHLLASWSISGTIQTQLLVHIITCVGHSSQDLSLEGN